MTENGNLAKIIPQFVLFVFLRYSKLQIEVSKSFW